MKFMKSCVFIMFIFILKCVLLIFWILWVKLKVLNIGILKIERYFFMFKLKCVMWLLWEGIL